MGEHLEVIIFSIYNVCFIIRLLPILNFNLFKTYYLNPNFAERGLLLHRTADTLAGWWFWTISRVLSHPTSLEDGSGFLRRLLLFLLFLMKRSYRQYKGCHCLLILCWRWFEIINLVFFDDHLDIIIFINLILCYIGES